MSFTYENQRVHFQKIEKAYHGYLALYRSLNNGSIEGATSFDIFYWRMVYFSRYHDKQTFGQNSF
jgi:hypothetical protein